MMESSILNLLRNLGWTDGFHIPVANEENKILEVKVAEKMKQKMELASFFSDLQHNVTSLKQFSKNIHEQRIQNQDMLSEYHKQMKIEENLLTEVKFEKEKLNKELKDVRAKHANLLDRKMQLLAEIEKSTEKINVFQRNLEWCDDVQKFLDDCINSQMNDINLIKEYKLQDDKKYEELELKRTRLCIEVTKHKISITQKKDEKAVLQCELNQIIKLYKKKGKDREQLMNQWESALKVLKTRDSDINKKVQEISILKEVIRSSESALFEEKEFWKEQIRNNMEIANELNDVIRHVRLSEAESKSLKTQLQQAEDTLAEHRLDLFKLENQVKQERQNINCILKEISEKKVLKENLLKKKRELKQSRQDIDNKSLSVNVRMKKIEQIYKNHEKMLKALEKTCDNKKISIQKLKDKLTDSNRGIEKINADIRHYNDIRHNVDGDILKINEEVKRENNLGEKLDREIKEMDSKICYIKDEKEDEHKVKLEQQLEKLTIDLEEKKREHSLLVDQAKKIDNEIKLIEMNSIKTIEKIMKEKMLLEQLELTVENDEKKLNDLIERNREKQLEENMFRIQLEKLRKIFNEENNALYQLKNQKIEIEAFVKERTEEISMAKNVLIMRKRAVLKENSDIKKNIECLMLRINQLRKKYEVIIESLGKDEDGQPLSLSSYKIALVKERAKLLEEGDELDGNIRKAEKEIEAMENTRQLVNVVNDNYKQNLCPDKFIDKRKEISDMEQQCSDLYDILRQKRDSLKSVENVYQELVEKENAEKNKFNKLKEKECMKMNDKEKLKASLDEQLEKISKLDSQIKSVLRSKKMWKCKLDANLIMRDIEIRILQELNKRAIQELGELVASHVEMVPVVKQYLSEKNISLPASAMYRAKSSARSTASRCSSKLSIDDANSCLSNDSVATPNVINIDSSLLNLSASSIADARRNCSSKGASSNRN